VALPLLTLALLSLASLSYPNRPVHTGDPLDDAMCQALEADLPRMVRHFDVLRQGEFSGFHEWMQKFADDPRYWEARRLLDVPLTEAEREVAGSTGRQQDDWFWKEVHQQNLTSGPLLEGTIQQWMGELLSGENNDEIRSFPLGFSFTEAVTRMHEKELSHFYRDLERKVPSNSCIDYLQTQNIVESDELAAWKFLRTGNNKPEYVDWRAYPLSNILDDASAGRYFGTAAARARLIPLQLETVGVYKDNPYRWIETLAADAAKRHDADDLNELQLAVVRMSRQAPYTVDGADRVRNFRVIRQAVLQHWQLNGAQRRHLNEIETLENRLSGLYPDFDRYVDHSLQGRLMHLENEDVRYSAYLVNLIDPHHAFTLRALERIAQRFVMYNDRNGETARQINAGWDVLAYFDYNSLVAPDKSAPEVADAPSLSTPGRPLSDPALPTEGSGRGPGKAADAS
jgi:hypothetical protein